MGKQKTIAAKTDKTKNIILVMQGGAGDVLAHTPAIRYFRKTYTDAKIIVISTYNQLLENNPNIDELFSFDESNDIYSEFIHNKDIYFYKKHFVYDNFLDSPMKKSKNLLEFICNNYDAKWDGEYPEYFITDREKRFASEFMNQFTKPVVLLHTTGSIPSEQSAEFKKVSDIKDMDPAVLEKVIKVFSDQYDFLQIGLEGEPLVPGALDGLGMKMREAIAIIPHCASFIFIESLFAHCSAALHKSGVVVFNNTDPVFFGYDHNINVGSSGQCDDWPCNRPLGALFDLSPGFINPKTREKTLWRCKHRSCTKKSPEIIIKALKASLKTNAPEIKKPKVKVARENFHSVKGAPKSKFVPSDFSHNTIG